MYHFRTPIPGETFQEFIRSASFAPITQTIGWAALKNDWTSYFCGLYRDETLCGVALILMRRLLPGFTYAYCPRGPVMDLADPEAVAAFAEGAGQFCRRKGCYLLKIDPPVVVGKTLPDLPAAQYLDPFDAARGQLEFSTLVHCGFRHKGFPKEMGLTIQPRFHAYIPLKDAAGEPLAPEQLRKNYKTKLRKYLGSFQLSRGLFYQREEPTEEVIALFKQILSATEERQQIALRSEGYFRLLARAFGPDAHFAFEKCRPAHYINFLRQRIAAGDPQSEYLRQQLLHTEEMMQQHGDIIPLSALLTVYPPNETGVRVAEYLYAGSDLSRFPSFNATLCGLCSQCLLCIEQGCDLLNLGGLSGQFNDGLYQFKSGFHPIIVEFAGEFDLILRPLSYRLMEKAFPTLKALYQTLRKKLRH